MQDYKPNSHRFKEEQQKNPQSTSEEKKFEKSVTGAVTPFSDCRSCKTSRMFWS